jgi:hypothetical protein
MKRVKCSLSTFGLDIPPAPSVRAFYFLPRINHSEFVDFLIDTGASDTCLNGIQARDLQSLMHRDTLEVSIGIGTCGYFHEPAIIIFTDESGKPFAKKLQLLGVQCIKRKDLNNNDVLMLPNLLGRDILNDTSFIYDPNPGNVFLKFHKYINDINSIDKNK